MPDRGVGVTDQTSGTGVADIRARERQVGGATYAEQYVIPARERVTTAIVLYSIVNTVQGTAHTAPAGFFWILNHVGSTVNLVLRRINFASQHNTLLATPTGPRIMMRRVTFTGAPTGTTVTGAKSRTADTATATWSVRSANTGLTITQGADIFAFYPVCALTAVGACPPAYEDWNPEDEGMIQLAAGEGIACWQPDAGTGSDTRRFVTNFSVEEFQLP
jgi:hypothetical protein